MANYSGGFIDFERFIGPRLRNVVQTKISRKYKKEIGKCEVCNTTEKLEAAHVHGRGRKTLMKMAYEKYFVDDFLKNVDLNSFEVEFINMHYPLEDNFRILCRTCHLEYDNIKEKIEVGEEIYIEAQDNVSLLSTLEIQLYPSDVDEFKELLLQYKSAYIKINFNDGTYETKEWNAARFSETSDVLNNLRSRPEFRQGNWQESKISNIEVEINY